MNSAAPAIVTKVNARVAAVLAKADTPVLPDACKAQALPVSVGNDTVGTLKVRAPNDTGKFRATLAFDWATTDIAIGLLRDLKLGCGAAPDLLAIGLSATDYVGHYFGTEGAEMCAQVLGVDANVGRILTALDATHLPYVVALTADHGGHDIPERIRRESIADADRVDDALSPERMGGNLQIEFNLPEAALLGVSASGDISSTRACLQIFAAEFSKPRRPTTSRTRRLLPCLP